MSLYDLSARGQTGKHRFFRRSEVRCASTPVGKRKSACFSVSRDVCSGSMNATDLRSKLNRIRFSCSRTRGSRIHYLTPDDVRVLLSRLPAELWERLRAVHFNDRSVGRRIAGYVNMGHREIAICALPASISCSSCILFTSRKFRCSPSAFGAVRGKQWPRLAVRRFLLYELFLHEVGHLQIVDPSAKTTHRRFASESLAWDFANRWRRTLWSQHFDHPDPVHNPPENGNDEDS